ncbi:serine/threonine/tyrosine-interacting-like protein 2 [Spea bombifrons]|uniref:serine/threonine/tyrosine-interacting-like protein 2 n=1 Tax=Spea bombifrons TaxID=233779 RepID=UPI0023490B5C|nr:serine/threonine/tyrosine-interacting-like protein 2 [Spea bombifrons]
MLNAVPVSHFSCGFIFLSRTMPPVPLEDRSAPLPRPRSLPLRTIPHPCLAPEVRGLQPGHRAPSHADLTLPCPLSNLQQARWPREPCSRRRGSPPSPSPKSSSCFHWALHPLKCGCRGCWRLLRPPRKSVGSSCSCDPIVTFDPQFMGVSMVSYDEDDDYSVRAIWPDELARKIMSRTRDGTLGGVPLLLDCRGLMDAEIEEPLPPPSPLSQTSPPSSLVGGPGRRLQSLYLLLEPLKDKEGTGSGRALVEPPVDEGIVQPEVSLVPPLSPDIERAELSLILPFLFLGNEKDAQDLGRMVTLNIGHVLNVTTHLPLYHAESGALRYKRLPATDNSKQDLRQYFEEAFEFIEEAQQKGKGVLIHCQAGVSRSATVVIAYLMKHTLMTVGDAYKFVKGKRPIISPNLNFMGQLMEFESDLNSGTTPRILIPRLRGVESDV